MEKVTKDHNSWMALHDALKQTLDIISKKMNEQQNQGGLSKFSGNESSLFIDALPRYSGTA